MYLQDAILLTGLGMDLNRNYFGNTFKLENEDVVITVDRCELRNTYFYGVVCKYSMRCQLRSMPGSYADVTFEANGNDFIEFLAYNIEHAIKALRREEELREIKKCDAISITWNITGDAS